MIARSVAAHLFPDAARVVAQLFLPGEELHGTNSRASQIVSRVMALPELEVEHLAAGLITDFGPRHSDYCAMLRRHAASVSAHVHQPDDMSDSRLLVLGAHFTAEFAIEGAALCNPSAVLHPDQSGLSDSQIRVAVSLRGIGEGHISSIGFCSAVIGPGTQWTFEQRSMPLCTAVTSPGTWRRDQLRAVLTEHEGIDELAQAVLHDLPETFQSVELERVLAQMHYELLVRSGAAATVDLLRRVVGSSYVASFGAESRLGQRVLMPSAEEESHGMEDARFTRFVDADATVEYRATYTAYDGRRIAPRLLVSPDLSTFSAHRLAGSAARNKGMALFPRKVNGQHVALCRSDGESTSLASSDDGFVWNDSVLLQRPEWEWEALQVGNCGPPMETGAGWLVLTHGVGPMRVYSIGAILLDLDDPAKVIARLRQPLLMPANDQRDGYVPSVVYSCGAVLHEDTIWLPYGLNDGRIGVAYLPLAEVLGALSSDS